MPIGKRYGVAEDLRVTDNDLVPAVQAHAADRDLSLVPAQGAEGLPRDAGFEGGPAGVTSGD